MPTKSEKYHHAQLTNDELEARIAADMYELSERLNGDVGAIGGLIWVLMGQVREAYRTASLIICNKKEQ